MMRRRFSKIARFEDCRRLTALPLAILFAGLIVCTPSTEADDSDLQALAALQLQDPSVEYAIRFTATWSAATHSGGTLGIPANPHFSPPIGVSHSTAQSFWQSGATASDGIESMAETGSVTLIAAEMRAAGLEPNILPGGVLDSPGELSSTFTIRRSAPCVTIVSMLAPSPDWFVGTRCHSLLDASTGDFVQSSSLELLAYDAGTDSGTSFTAADSDTNPRIPIALVTDTPLANNPVVQLEFTRL